MILTNDETGETIDLETATDDEAMAWFDRITPEQQAKMEQDLDEDVDRLIASVYKVTMANLLIEAAFEFGNMGRVLAEIREDTP